MAGKPAIRANISRARARRDSRSAASISLDQVGERNAFLGGFLRQRGILCSDSAKPEFVAQLDHALMLDAHPTSAVISSSYTLSEC
jgi:hypothetical protein